VKRAERDAILRQGVVLPETPRERRERAALEEDLRTIPLRGEPLPIRARHFRPSAETYLVATRGPLPYMLRLREIEQRTADHETALEAAWRALADEHAGDPEAFARAWERHAATTVFDEVNDLVDRHNLWFPVESRHPMDPPTGDYALVNGHDYRLERLDSEWVLERFPAELSSVAVSP
jgi:hypothetical protein